MSVLTVADLRRNSLVDQRTGCWHWQRAKSVVDGTPRIYTFDHERGEKRVMSGPKAVWNIAHQEAPGRYLIFRRCGCMDCVQPVHMARAATRAEQGAHIAASGRRKGRVMSPAQYAVLMQAREAAGLKNTPLSVVLAIRSASPAVTGRCLAKLHAVSETVVSGIRLGKTYRCVA